MSAVLIDAEAAALVEWYAETFGHHGRDVATGILSEALGRIRQEWTQAASSRASGLLPLGPREGWAEQAITNAEERRCHAPERPPEQPESVLSALDADIEKLCQLRGVFSRGGEAMAHLRPHRVRADGWIIRDSFSVEFQEEGNLARVLSGLGGRPLSKTFIPGGWIDNVHPGFAVGVLCRDLPPLAKAAPAAVEQTPA